MPTPFASTPDDYPGSGFTWVGIYPFHWYQDMFMPRLTGNDSPDLAAGSFGEGVANTMTAISRDHGSSGGYIVQDFPTSMKSEFLEFNGNFRPKASGDLVPALPDDLFVTTFDGGTGGWSWRILWDFFDGTGSEPVTRFTRYNELGKTNPAFTDYGAFDKVGGSQSDFRDVLTKYLGGNYLPMNSSLPNIDNQGFKGLDMTEFLDGMLCRGHTNSEKLERLVKDVMDFRRYDAGLAPQSCP